MSRQSSPERHEARRRAGTAGVVGTRMREALADRWIAAREAAAEIQELALHGDSWDVSRICIAGQRATRKVPA